MAAWHPDDRRERLVSALASTMLVAGLGYALVVGLGVSLPAVADNTLTLLQLAPLPPPTPERHVVQARSAKRRPQGEAAPPARRAIPTEVVAPKPIVILPPPIVLPAAPVAGPGAEARSGAAPFDGPGTGAGGIGNGRGSGGSGDGDGGGGYDDETPPRLIRGRLKNGDYPREIGDAGIDRRVTVEYRVEADGRVTGCTIRRSSGIPALDATTCRLITQRFRYAPSRDGAGRPVASRIIANHEWVGSDAPQPADDEDDG